MKNKGEIIKEFIRYVFVGGVAFLVDFGVFTLLRETLYSGRDDGVAIGVATAAGFVVGLAVNYFLSMAIVFRKENQREKGRTVSAVITFAAVGVVGFVLTMALQQLGERYLLSLSLLEGAGKLGKYGIKVCVTGIVLVWNYVGRKVFVFKGE